MRAEPVSYTHLIEAGTLEFCYSNVELNDIISEIESVTRYRTESNGIQLMVQKDVYKRQIHHTA